MGDKFRLYDRLHTYYTQKKMTDLKFDMSAFQTNQRFGCFTCPMVTANFGLFQDLHVFYAILDRNKFPKNLIIIIFFRSETCLAVASESYQQSWAGRLLGFSVF